MVNKLSSYVESQLNYLQVSNKECQINQIQYIFFKALPIFNKSGDIYIYFLIFIDLLLLWSLTHVASGGSPLVSTIL